MLAANNGKKPEGCMGAYEIAKKAWQETKNKECEDCKGQPHLNSKIENENEDEDCETPWMRTALMTTPGAVR